MRSIALILMLFAAPAFADTFSASVARGYVGPIQVNLIDGLTPPGSGSTAVLTVYGRSTFQKLGVLQAPASFLFSLEALDTFFAGTYSAELTISDGGVVYAWNGTVAVQGRPSTATPPAPGAPPVLPQAYGQSVGVCPSGCTYTSVATAVASITDASASKPYVVRVAPGVYAEPPITMKSYVNVDCDGGLWFACLLNATDQTQSFIRGAASSTFRGFAVKGPTCTDCAALDYQGTGYTPWMIDHVSISTANIGLWVHPTATGTAHADVLVNHYGGSAMTDFVRVEDHGNLAMRNSAFMSGPSNAVARGFVVSGASAVLTLDLVDFNNGGSAEAFYADNGARMRMTSCTVHQGGNGIHVGPNGANTIVTAVGTVIDTGFTHDIWVESASGTVWFSGGVATHSNMLATTGATLSGDFADLQINHRVVLGGIEFGNGATAGPTIHFGAAAPADNPDLSEINGSVYLRTDGGGQLYQRQSGVWVLK